MKQEKGVNVVISFGTSLLKTLSMYCSHGNDNDEIKIEQLHDKRKNRERFKAKELSYMISVKAKSANMYDFLKKLVNSLVKSLFKSPPLDPKDALFSGRTSPGSLKYAAKENEKIMYLDFTSLYPSVQKKNILPVGHASV